MGEFNKVTYLYGWCQKIIPLVYDDSLSYYEMLCKVREKLNEVITNTNMIPEMIKQEVQDFINSGQIEEMIEEILTGYLQRIVVNVVVPPQGIAPAKGNGNDDTETFQQCIDYLAESGGGLLFVPDGDWMVKPLTIKNGVYIAGASVSTKITLIGGSPAGLISGTVTNCGVSRLTLSNNAAQQTVDKAVVDITCNNITLDDLIVKNGYMGVNVTVNNGALIRGIKFDTLGYGGLYVNGSNADVSVSEVTVKNVSIVSGQFGVDNNCARAVYNHIAVYGPLPTGFSNTGASVTLKNAIIVDCETGIFNVGDDCDFNAFVNGNTEIINDTGERTSYNFKGQNSQRKIGKQLLNIGTGDPIMYRTPTPINNSFSAIPFQDYSGNQYNVLVEGEYLQSNIFISAADFGVVGDGVTDNTQMLNTFFTYLATNNAIGFIPNGTYYTAGQVGYIGTTGRESISFFGESRNGVIFKRAVGSTTSGLRFSTCVINRIANFTIDCQGTPEQTNGHGINFQNVNTGGTDRGVVEDITINNVSYSGIQVFSSDPPNIYNNGLTFKNIIISGLGKEFNTDLDHPTGFILDNVRYTSIIDSVVLNVRRYAFEFKDYCRYCTMYNCTAIGCFQGFVLGGSDPSVSNYYCSNISMSNIKAINTDFGFYAGKATSITVDNYQFTATSSSVYAINCIDTNDMIFTNSILYMSAATQKALATRDSSRIMLFGISYINPGGGGLYATSGTTDSGIIIVITGTNLGSVTDFPETLPGVGSSLAVLPLGLWKGATWQQNPT